MSAAAGILHPDALEVSKNFLDQLHQQGDKCWELNVVAMDEVRVLAAQLLNSKPEEICFVSSSSMAFSLAAQLLKNKGHRKFFSFREEFPTSTLPFINAGLEPEFATTDGFSHDWNQILKSHDEKSPIVLSSVESLTGFSHPIEVVNSFASEKGVPLLVNATQSLGVIPLDASKIPFVCASIHKWLMSGFGLSIFKVRQDYLDDPLPVYGWLSQKDPWKFFEHKVEPLREARVFELGCPALLQIFSLGAVLKWIQKMGGVSAIWSRVKELVEYTYSRSIELGLSPRHLFPTENRSSLIFFPVNDVGAAEKSLADQGIYVSARSENLRVAIHWYNNKDDIDRFLAAYSKLIK